MVELGFLVSEEIEKVESGIGLGSP